MMHGALLALREGSYWLPEPASTFGESVDAAFDFIFWTSLAFFLIIVGAMVWFTAKYRTRHGEYTDAAPAHSTRLELVWSIIPTGLLAVMFYLGWMGFMEMFTPPSDALELDVTARQWVWQFGYPTGLTHAELHVPAGEKVVLVMRSEDVIHSLFIPAFRTKMDVIPGRVTKLWFQATRPGRYPLLCAEFCGDGHSNMLSTVVVHEHYEAWKEWLKLADPLNLLTDEELEVLLDPARGVETVLKGRPELAGKLQAPAVLGQRLFSGKGGCTQCHRVDGTDNIGPNLRGLLGRTRAFADGTSRVADENYVRQSILDPGSQVVAGFPNRMSTFRGVLSDRELMMLIAYLKSLKEE